MLELLHLVVKRMLDIQHHQHGENLSETELKPDLVIRLTFGGTLKLDRRILSSGGIEAKNPPTRSLHIDDEGLDGMMNDDRSSS